MKTSLNAILMGALHSIFVSFITFIILFSNDIVVLSVANFIILIALVSNYLFGDCPYSLIEDKYSENSVLDISFFLALKISGKDYDKKLRGLLTLELLWIASLLLFEKILFLLIFRTFIRKHIL
jgi:hypothetical protein